MSKQLARGALLTRVLHERTEECLVRRPAL